MESLLKDLSLAPRNIDISTSHDGHVFINEYIIKLRCPASTVPIIGNTINLKHIRIETASHLVMYLTCGDDAWSHTISYDHLYELYGIAKGFRAVNLCELIEKRIPSYTPEISECVKFINLNEFPCFMEHSIKVVSKHLLDNQFVIPEKIIFPDAVKIRVFNHLTAVKKV